jgi:4-hydroxythreonine-4-phosphate dehydrogenase
MTAAAPPGSGSGNASPLALTMGEPAGVGGEITLKAWASNDTPPFFVIDDANRLQQLSDNLGLKIPIGNISEPEQAKDVFSMALPVLHRPLMVEAIPGNPHRENADAVIDAIRTAVQLVGASRVSGVVTNPIHKKSLYESGFNFPGHTEFLAELAGIETPPVMMLASPELKVVPVTIHVSVAQALNLLNEGDIVAMARITAQSLKEDFAITAPRLAIAGLNPHAGEGGGMGTEEIKVIEPAIKRLREIGIDATGPWPPDTLFHEAARKTYDAVICMYHDQALIPIKTIDFDGAVNVTLGLPFVRTSPDHGTAFDIAGKGTASEKSLLAALNMAADIAKRRCEKG